VEAEKTKTPEYTESFCTCCAMVHDYTCQFADITTETDLLKLSETDGETRQKFIKYEVERVNILNSRLQSTLHKVTEIEGHFSKAEETLFTRRVKPLVDVILKETSKEPDSGTLKEHCEEIQRACHNLLENLAELKLPPVKPRVAYLTDAGSGVGVSNFEVKFRDAEIARMYNSDYRVCGHCSRGDSG
jgi:hypothetical protein